MINNRTAELQEKSPTYFGLFIAISLLISIYKIYSEIKSYQRVELTKYSTHMVEGCLLTEKKKLMNKSRDRSCRRWTLNSLLSLILPRVYMCVCLCVCASPILTEHHPPDSLELDLTA